MCHGPRSFYAAEIAPTRSTVTCWRWPFFRRLFCRRRFLKMMTLSSRSCAITVAVTEAPAITGAPSVRLPSLPTASTSVNVTVAPGSASNFSTFSTASGVTRYCFPPVRITANISAGPFGQRPSGRQESPAAGEAGHIAARGPVSMTPEPGRHDLPAPRPLDNQYGSETQFLEIRAPQVLRDQVVADPTEEQQQATSAPVLRSSPV